MQQHEPTTPNNNRGEVKPTFAPLQPATVTTHLRQKQQELADRANDFPVSAFPQPVQQIIQATNSSLNFPIDFTGAAILFAVSVAIGNTHRVKVNSSWTDSALLYLALVGRPGTNKTPPP